jgi:hypothetical protein
MRFVMRPLGQIPSRALGKDLVAGEEHPMSGIPGVPEELINYLFNFDQGKHVDAYCDTCGKITDQVIVSYGQLSGLRTHELEKIMGRLLDIVPGARFFMGKPMFCRCGTVNR